MAFPPKISPMEKPMIFSNGGDSLFGILHCPEGSHPRCGVILCHPFGEEKLWSHRVFVNFAREAALRGIAVIRFDFRGHGDSSGSTEDNSLHNFSSDIDSAAARFLEECPSIECMGILGLRFGASLAALYASEKESINRIVLWEPIVFGARYMQELLRINLSTQMAVYRKVRKDREKLVQEMKAGVHANVDGYLINFGFYDECSALDLTAVAPANPEAQVLVTQIAPNINQKDRDHLVELTNMNNSAEFQKVVEPPFWREGRPFTSRTDRLIDETLNWFGQDNGK